MAHGKRKGDFKVEQDEQNRHEVVAHIELHARVFETPRSRTRRGRAFLDRVGWDQPACRRAIGTKAESDTDQDEQKDREIFDQHDGLFMHEFICRDTVKYPGAGTMTRHRIDHAFHVALHRLKRADYSAF
jgi:hypothetical protein